jgi:hypothetical protein
MIQSGVSERTENDSLIKHFPIDNVKSFPIEEDMLAMIHGSTFQHTT